MEGANWKLFFNQGDCRDTRFLVKFKFPRCCHSAQAMESYFEFAWLANLVAIICFLFGFAEIGSWLVRRWATPPPRPLKMAEKELSAILQLESIATCWVWRCTTHATLPFRDAPFFKLMKDTVSTKESLSFLCNQVHLGLKVLTPQKNLSKREELCFVSVLVWITTRGGVNTFIPKCRIP